VESRTSGSLVVVGTGVRFGSQLTPETRAAIDAADDVFYVVTDPLAETWFERLAPGAKSLSFLYGLGKRRADTYAEMVEEILAPVRKGRAVCVAVYGHPGVLVWPSHEAMKQARREGHAARMVPAVSAEDCLFADLGVDPVASGCQSYEATDFLVHRRTVDPTAYLVLWQVALIANVRYAQTPSQENLPVLVEYLENFFPRDHESVLYEASPFPVGAAEVRHVQLGALPTTKIPPMATLLVPPLAPPEVDRAMMRRLGLGGGPTQIRD
jgi:uncharacterized protein YabN with tetrapyrrole methylase and pyrophosphatase domain